MGTKEVKARLTLEDAASKTIDKIKGGFNELISVEKAADAGMGAIKTSLATMAGVYLPQLTRQALEFGKSFATAAAGGLSDDAAIAALASAVQDIPYEEAISRAGAYGDQLDRIAISTGVMNKSVGDAFQRSVELHGATTAGLERARDDTAQLAIITSKLKIPLEGAVQEVGLMGEGMLKSKGRMAQLLQATGVFGPSLKEAAKGWMALTEEKRLAIISDGLKRASSTVADMPRTFDQLVGSLENVYEISKEKLGEPLVEALTPELEKLVGWLDKNRVAVERFAHSMAKDVGHYVEEGTQAVERGFEYLTSHQKEIKEGIIEAFEFAKSTVQFILEHKEALAYAFGAKTLGPSALGLLKPAAGVVSSVYQAGAAGIGSNALGGAALSGAAGGALALGAFALAIGGATLAVDQFTKLMNETGGGKSDERLSFEALQRRFQEMLDNPDSGVWDSKQLDQFTSMREQITTLAEQVGESSRAAGELADAAFAAHRTIRDVVEPIDAAARALNQMSQTGVDAEAQDKAVAAIADGFMAAIQTNNMGAEQYIASVLAKSSSLQLAFLQSSVMTGAGFDTLAELVQGQAADFAEKLRQKADFAADKAAKPDVPKLQMNGGQTFKIQQDFRDEDPDRVVAVFQEGIINSAERRLQASTGTLFGG